MFNNVGLVDRLLRSLIAIVLLYFGLLVYAGSNLGIVMDVAGGIPYSQESLVPAPSMVCWALIPANLARILPHSSDSTLSSLH